LKDTIMTKKQILFLGAFVVTLAAAFALPALAADADWVQPLNEGVTSLTKSLVAIAGGVIGLCIVGFAIWSAVKQRLEGPVLVTLFACGLLVGIGPAAIIWWIDLMKQG